MPPPISVVPGLAAPPSRLRLGAVVWAAGMVGVVAVAVYIPEMARAFGEDLSEVPWWAPVAVVVQYGALVALFSAIGAAVGARLGLHAPVAEALAWGRPVGPALRSQLVPGLIGGGVGAALLVGAGAAAPAEIASLAGQWDPPLWLRVLYGGITEEVLLRWGVMTGLVWLGWRFLQRRDGAPSIGLVWGAIVGSSLLFAAGHLPAASALVGPLTGPVVAYVLLANSAFGLLAGWLYWKHGLGAAILAHAGAHVGAVAVAALGG